MMTLTHGTSGQLQSDYGFSVERLGYYLRLKASAPAETWVQYAPPTLILGAVARLDQVSIRLRTFGSATLAAVHVWDGTRPIIAHNTLDVGLNEAEPADEEGRITFGVVELDVRPASQVQSAIGVSLLVRAAAPLDAIAIAAVGLHLS